MQEIEKDILNLLAIIHRDGGHFTAAHGIAESISAARSKILEFWVEADRASAETARLLDAIEEMKTRVTEVEANENH